MPRVSRRNFDTAPPPFNSGIDQKTEREIILNRKDKQGYPRPPAWLNRQTTKD
jgi:hypothetical protein